MCDLAERQPTSAAFLCQLVPSTVITHHFESRIHSEEEKGAWTPELSLNYQGLLEAGVA